MHDTTRMATRMATRMQRESDSAKEMLFICDWCFASAGARGNAIPHVIAVAQTFANGIAIFGFVRRQQGSNFRNANSILLNVLRESQTVILLRINIVCFAICAIRLTHFFFVEFPPLRSIGAVWTKTIVHAYYPLDSSTSRQWARYSIEILQNKPRPWHSSNLRRHQSIASPLQIRHKTYNFLCSTFSVWLSIFSCVSSKNRFHFRNHRSIGRLSENHRKQRNKHRKLSHDVRWVAKYFRVALRHKHIPWSGSLVWPDARQVVKPEAIRKFTKILVVFFFSGIPCGACDESGRNRKQKMDDRMWTISNETHPTIDLSIQNHRGEMLWHKSLAYRLQ